jgi:hypothetical protein
MKISKNSEQLSNSRLLEETRKKAQDELKANKSTPVQEGGDSVRVPLAREIQRTLEALTSSDERRTRINEIKNLLQNGGAAAYFQQVPSDEVASKFAEEVNLEILSNSSRPQREEDQQ